MKNTLLLIVLCGINLSCYSGEELKINTNNCNTINYYSNSDLSNTIHFVLWQSEPEIMPFINNHYFVIKQLETYYSNNNVLIKKLKRIKNSVVKIMDNKLKSYTSKNYNIIVKFNDYINILNDLKQDNTVSKTVIKEVISSTENAIRNTKRRLILLDKLEI